MEDHFRDTELRRLLEDDAVRLAIHRVARAQNWRPCCRSFVTERMLGDLTRPIELDPDDGHPLCPLCARAVDRSRVVAA